MKSSRNQPTKPAQPVSHTPKPEIRDNLDSRKNEEQDFKGDDVTNNRKEKHSRKPGKKGPR